MELNMHRLPYAAETLRDEIKKWDEDATFEATDRDGLGVFRTLVVTTDRNKELGDLLEPIAQLDKRIFGFLVGDGIVSVVFTTHNAADHRDSFHLPNVAKVFAHVSEKVTKQPTKKTTRKKTTTKKP